MNNNIEEAYCSLGISKILRDKGFHVYCEKLFNPNTNEPQSSPSDNTIPAIARPTHAVAIEWIRVNFGIWTRINSMEGSSWLFDIWNFSVKKANTAYSDSQLIFDEQLFNSPQEATEAALLYTLKNLI